jgi:hypothetical protein
MTDTATPERRKPTCCVDDCDKPHASNTGYCREHRNAYQRAWRARQRAELLQLRALADDPVKVPRGTRVGV